MLVLPMSKTCKTGEAVAGTREPSFRLYSRHVYKERLGLSSKTIIGYQAHADTAAKSNSLAKNRFVV